MLVLIQFVCCIISAQVKMRCEMEILFVCLIVCIILSITITKGEWEVNANIIKWPLAKQKDVESCLLNTILCALP